MEFVFVGALVGMIGYLSWHFSEAEKIKRALRKAERWPIVELPENTHGKIIGTARAVDKPLLAPISGRSCVYYVVVVRKGADKAVKQILREARGVPFLLEDETGRALIDPKDCAIDLVFDAWTSTGHDRSATDAEAELLKRHGFDAIDLRGYEVRYEESIIEVGESVAILGSGIREPDPEGAPGAMYRDAPVTRLRLTSSARFPLVISDHRTIAKT